MLDLRLLLGADLLQLCAGLNLRGVGLELRLLHRGGALDLCSLGASLRLGSGLALALDSSALGLQLEELDPRALGVGLVRDLLPLKEAASLLLLALGLMPGSGLLRLGRDLDGHLHGLLERVAGALVNGLHRLDVDVGDHQVVGRELQALLRSATGVLAEDSELDHVRAGPVEVLERSRGHGTAHARSNGLAGIAYEVGNLEDLLGSLGVLVLDIEVPVVGQLQGEAGVVRSLDRDDVSHKVGAKEHAEALDGSLRLGLAARERDQREVLVGAQHNEVGSEEDARLVGGVVVHLHGSVVRCAVGNDAGLVAGLDRSDRARVAGLGVEKVLDSLRELLLPELLAGLEHVGLACDGAHLAVDRVADVDALVLVERDGAALLQDLDLHGRDVVSGAVDHPLVARLAQGVGRVGELLLRTEQKSLLLVEHVHVLDAVGQALAGGEEERDFALAELHLRQAVASIGADGVQHNAVLPVAQGGDGNNANHLLVDIRDVRLSILNGHEPLGAGLALLAEDVLERRAGAEVEGLLLREDVCGDGRDDLLVDARHVGARSADEPLLASAAVGAVHILALAPGLQLESLVLANNRRADDLHDLDLDTRHVGARANEEPLVASIAGDLVLREVADAAEAESSVRGNNLERADLANHTLARVEGERLLLEPNLLIAVLEADVVELVENDTAILTTNHGVGNHAVVPGRHHKHGQRAIDDLLVLLACERLRANLNAADVAVVVQHMDVLERLDADHVRVARHFAVYRGTKTTEQSRTMPGTTAT
mmetsp:Transcript_4165/g.14696  ORF Transcript_4165/g.14696 Transcript_4165/m.14696 type:complete len:771 (-) Transcript_4165:86-2398(-)